jgi:hypothetical protein
MENLKKSAEVSIFPVVNVIRYTSTFMSLVNVAVFLQPKMRHHPILRYLLVMSLADALYTLSMSLFVPVSSLCVWLRENERDDDVDLLICYVSMWHYILISEYFTSCLALFNVLVEIHITCQRIKLISSEARNNEKAMKPFVICTVIFAVSLAVYSPVLFMNKITTVETRNETTGAVRRDYINGKTEFGKSQAAVYIEKSLTVFRIFLISVALSIVNVVASVKFTAFYKRKSALKERIRGNFLIHLLFYYELVN